MFSTKMKESINNTVNITNINEDVFEELDVSFYIYTGEVSKLNDLAAVLVVVADKYDIDNLKLICEEKRVLQI